MKTKIKVLIALVFLTLASNVYSFDHEDKLYHAGGSFAINHVLYVVCKNQLKFSKNECIIGSSVVTMGLGLAKEYVKDPQADPYDILANSGGIGLSIPFLIWEY